MNNLTTHASWQPGARRLASNRNLSLVDEPTYQGFPLVATETGFIREYLDSTYATIQKALAEHPRLLAVRFDLHFPTGMPTFPEGWSNTAIQRFVDALKARVAADRRRAARHNPYAHQTTVRYVWVREIGESAGRPHYHVLLLLNRDAYYTMGRLGSGHRNMWCRVQEAWASALGLALEHAAGLVHVPRNAEYRIDRQQGAAGLHALMQRVSYLCKVRSKQYGDGRHAFGCSRR